MASFGRQARHVAVAVNGEPDAEPTWAFEQHSWRVSGRRPVRIAEDLGECAVCQCCPSAPRRDKATTPAVSAVRRLRFVEPLHDQTGVLQQMHSLYNDVAQILIRVWDRFFGALP